MSVMLDSRVALKSFNAEFSLTLSARLFDHSVINSSCFSCEFLFSICASVDTFTTSVMFTDQISSVYKKRK